MDKKENNVSAEYYTIDLLHILKRVWHYIWAVALASLLAAVIGFSYASFLIAPKYSSSVMLYVNNTSISLGGADFTISSSQISAAQSLVDTYSEILKSRTTLEQIIEKTGVSHGYKSLSGMIVAGPANETEIMKVTVTCEDPEEAALIANCITEVLPIRISEIIEGASMEIVDTAVPNYHKVSPSVTMYTMVGFILGFVFSVGVIAVFAIMDDTVHDEDYILQTYNYPILAKIPDLLDKDSKRYGRYGRYGYYYYRHRGNSEDSENTKKTEV
jgi:capsular polysaccharide biosynthesis protein